MNLCQLLAAYGVTDVVLCPGSRNAPINLAIASCTALHSVTAIDERTGAFMALGMALGSGKPAAFVCTSGTALLDASPAVAEAYYRRVPVVVISADRPAEWIDQDDSQTLRQPSLLAQVVRHSVNIPVAGDSGDAYVSRLLNEALGRAVDGPVHINMQIDNPALPLAPSGAYNIIRCIRPSVTAAMLREDDAISSIAREIALCRSVAVYAGGLNQAFLDMDALESTLESLARKGVTVIAEFQSGLHSGLFVRKISFVPDVLLSFGGAPVSAAMKKWFRTNPPKRHVRLSATDFDSVVDTYRCLTESIAVAPLPVLQLIDSMRPVMENPVHADFTPLSPDAVEWSDVRAVGMILNAARSIDIHISNGTLIRIVQRYRLPQGCRAECNRGVSGIDGSTSTAVGSAAVGKRPLLLLTGDMSFRYDIGALGLPSIPPSMRIVVMDNGGGGIFRFAKSTSRSAACEPLFCRPGGAMPPVSAIAALYGWSAAEASSPEELQAVLDSGWLTGASTCPRLLTVITDPARSAAEFARVESAP